MVDFNELNPLTKYYRIPGLSVKLPTNGVFMPPGSIQFTVAGDIPVYPMAMKDEMLLKSPDALMSGEALEKLIESCVPAIKIPRAIATQDLDVLLLAIRAATYGDIMHLNALCPECKTNNEIQCHLPSLLGTMQMVDPNNAVRITDELMIYVRPYNLHNATVLALATYDEMRKLQAIETDEPKVSTYERNKAVTRGMDRMNKLNLDLLADCIVKIVIPTTEVTDKRSIVEFIANVPKTWIEQVEIKLKEINGKGVDKTLHVICDKCQHEWDTEVEFNPSNFFDAASSPSLLMKK